MLKYTQSSKACRLLDSGSSVIMESIHVEFIENGVDSYKISYSNVTNKRNSDSSQLELRRSQRVRKEKHLSSNFMYSQAIVFLVEGNRTKVCNKIPILLNVEDDPKTFQEVMSSKGVAFWKEAIND